MELTVTEKGYKEFAEIVRAEAHSGKILLFTEEGRAGDDLAAALALAGLTITRREVTERVLSDYASLSRTEMPEGIMAVAGAGGAAATEAAKGIRLTREIPRLLIPLDLSALTALDARAFFGTQGDVLTLHSADARVLFDPEILACGGHVREGLGELLALWVEKADATYESLIERGSCPADALDVLKRAAAHFSTISESKAAKSVTETALAWMQDAAFRDLPVSSSAHTLAMLASKSSGGKYVDYFYPASYALLRLYERYLGDLPLEHAAPPDRARNVELLEKRCGMAPSPLLARAKGYADGYEHRMRLTAEYREDLAETLSHLPLAALSRVYRRAHKEAGEEVLPPPTALLALLSLTGEAVSGYPLVKHIKTTGLLEPLLVAS